jgi:phosphatidylglycerol:prolipoprotein diacylglycerol transferase
MLFHIYGPFAIHAYGLCIAIGVFISCYLLRQHPLFKNSLFKEHFETALLLITGTALIGGRVLYFISSGQPIQSLLDFFAVWNGGLSILGAFISALITFSLYLRYLKIPILETIDLICIHVGLLQAIGRIGCFFAGCCHGTEWNGPLAIMYQNKDALAPLHIYLHPTQLYSSITLFCIFLFMYFYAQHRFKQPGQCTALYLLLMSSERFLNDFLRDERYMFTSTFSINQLIALGLISISFLFLYETFYRKKGSFSGFNIKK